MVKKENHNLYSMASKKVELIKEFVNEYYDSCRVVSGRFLRDINRMIYNINAVEKRHKYFKCAYVEELKTAFNKSVFDKEYILEIKNKSIANIPEEPKVEYIKGVRLVNDINTDVINMVVALERLYKRAEKFRDKLLEIYKDPTMVASINSMFNKIK